MTGKVFPLRPPARADRPAAERMARVTLRKWRCSSGLTQEQAAQWLGVDETTIRRWESGRCAVPAWVLVATRIERSEAA